MGNYDKIYELASGAYGLITTAEAHSLGVSDKELSRLTSSGKLFRLGRGVYRVMHHVPSRLDQYAVAVAVAGDRARLFGQSVLAMLGLCATNPRWVEVGVTRRVRRALPPYVLLRRVGSGEAIAHYEGIASQPVAMAIIAARSSVEGGKLRAAAAEARRRGLLLENEFEEVMEALAHE